MIVSNNINIKVNSMDIKKLLLLKITASVGDIINVPISFLSSGSGRKIKVKCDICGKEKELAYEKYNKNIEKYDYYSCSTKCSLYKIEQTCLKNFGETNASKSKNKKIKREKTIMEKYGVSNAYQSEIIKEKIKNTCLKKYGVDNIFKSEEFKCDMRKYNMEKYGVEYISQVPEIYNKQQKSGFKLKKHKNTNLYYRGTYEKDFLDYCYNNNIPIKQGKRIKYNYKNKDHYYFSDFFVESKNLIIEIKSNWTYNKYLDVNKIKREYTIKKGYDYMFIIDKDYSEFFNLINND